MMPNCCQLNGEWDTVSGDSGNILILLISEALEGPETTYAQRKENQKRIRTDINGSGSGGDNRG